MAGLPYPDASSADYALAMRMGENGRRRVPAEQSLRELAGRVDPVELSARMLLEISVLLGDAASQILGSMDGNDGFSLEDKEREYTIRRWLDRYIELGERLERETLA